MLCKDNFCGCIVTTTGQEENDGRSKSSNQPVKSEIVAKLPEGWSDVQACSWITPQPAIAPTTEIRQRVEALNRRESCDVKKLS
ncbi:unnamed protein product [Urochloa humidicola]